MSNRRRSGVAGADWTEIETGLCREVRSWANYHEAVVLTVEALCAFTDEEFRLLVLPIDYDERNRVLADHGKFSDAASAIEAAKRRMRSGAFLRR